MLQGCRGLEQKLSIVRADVQDFSVVERSSEAWLTATHYVQHDGIAQCIEDKSLLDLQIVSNLNCNCYQRLRSAITCKQPEEFTQNAIVLQAMALEEVHSTASPSLPDIVFL